MPWLELSLKASKDQVDHYSDILLDLEAQAITLQDAEEQDLLEPLPGETPLWQSTWVTGLFAHDVDKAKLLEALGLQIDPMPAYQIRLLQDQAWERTWLEYFRPICFAEKFWICPSQWEPPEPQAPTLILDPGLAFGTGSHATTYLCLEWLAQQTFMPKTMLDYGCGSGILALSALKLGCESATCVDIDEQALQATQDNARRNGLEKKVSCAFPQELRDQRFPLVVANILLEPLIALSEDLYQLLQPKGQLLLAGVLDEQFSNLQHAYKKKINLEKIAIRDQWILVLGRK